MKEKLDPYAALRFKEFNFFLVIRFILVFGWSMQFIIVEWEVYSLTKDPLSLGLIGLVGRVMAQDLSHRHKVTSVDISKENLDKLGSSNVIRLC